MVANWTHGPYESGQLLFTAKEALELRLRDCLTEDLLLEIAELMAVDGCLDDVDGVSIEMAKDALQHSLDRRPDYVPQQQFMDFVVLRFRMCGNGRWNSGLLKFRPLGG